MIYLSSRFYVPIETKKKSNILSTLNRIKFSKFLETLK